MLDLRIMDKGRAVPLGDLPALLGRKVAYDAIGAQIDGMIALLDDLAGDPDLEDNGDHEASDGDDKDVSWFEWQGGRRGSLHPHALQNEDDELDDEDRCSAGDDMIVGGPAAQRELWTIGFAQPGDDTDAEGATWECGEKQGHYLADTRLQDDMEPDGSDDHPARIIHLNRIRATRCTVSMIWGRPTRRMTHDRAAALIRANDL